MSRVRCPLVTVLQFDKHLQLSLLDVSPVFSDRETPFIEVRKEGIGFYVAFNSLGHIATR